MPRLVVALTLGLAVALGIAVIQPGMAAEVRVKSARFEQQFSQGGQHFTLIGYGLLRYLVWDAYAGAYYQAVGYPRPAPQSNVPRRLTLEYFHAIEAEEFAEATRETLYKQLGNEAYDALTPALETFNASYRDVVPNDRYALTWNGQRLGMTLNGETLYDEAEPSLAAALFGIWLGAAPLDEDFRDVLLGR